MNTRNFLNCLLILSLGAVSLPAQTPPSALAVYPLVKSPTADPSQTAALARRFLGDVQLRTYNQSEDTMYLASPLDLTTRFEHNTITGDVSFHRGLARYLGDFAPRLPSKDEAIRTALIYLRTNKLLPQNMQELKLAHVGGLRAQSVIGGKKGGPIIDKLITLSYSRIVDGLPVVGPGSRFILDIGEAGEVLGMTRHWREVDLKNKRMVGRMEVYTPEEVRQLATKQIAVQFGEKSTFRLLKSLNALYDNNGGILQPVAILETQISLGDKVSKPFNYLCVIPLLRKSPEPLSLTAVDPAALKYIKTLDQKNLPPPSTRPVSD